MEKGRKRPGIKVPRLILPRAEAQGYGFFFPKTNLQIIFYPGG